MTPEQKRAESARMLRELADRVELGNDDGYVLTEIFHHAEVFNPELGFADDMKYMGATLVISTLPLGVVTSEMNKRYQAENGLQFGLHR